MPIYTVRAKEMVFYEIRIDAENEKAAYAAVMDYGLSGNDIVESEDFEITAIELRQEAAA